MHKGFNVYAYRHNFITQVPKMTSLQIIACIWEAWQTDLRCEDGIQPLLYTLAFLWSHQDHDPPNVWNTPQELLHQTLAQKTCSSCDEDVFVLVEISHFWQICFSLTQSHLAQLLTT